MLKNKQLDPLISVWCKLLIAADLSQYNFTKNYLHSSSTLSTPFFKNKLPLPVFCITSEVFEGVWKCIHKN